MPDVIGKNMTATEARHSGKSSQEESQKATTKPAANVTNADVIGETIVRTLNAMKTPGTSGGYSPSNDENLKKILRNSLTRQELINSNLELSSGKYKPEKVVFVLLGTKKTEKDTGTISATPTSKFKLVAQRKYPGKAIGDLTPKEREAVEKAAGEKQTNYRAIEMYVNPQNFIINYQKIINQQQTQGGYVFQYWGEKPVELSLSGITGNSGIIGINDLYDVYMNQGKKLGQVDGTEDWNSSQIDIHFKDVIYTGHFTTFSVTEAADRVGIWQYDLKFTVVETFGRRMRF